jgi:hypothetical protein
MLGPGINLEDLPLGKFQEQVEADFISVKELAQLAATLLAGGGLNLSMAAQMAIELWQECRDERERAILRLARRERARAAQEELEKLPSPEFPCSYDEFLKFMLPGKRSEDRAKIHREYVRQQFQSPPTDAEISEAITRDKRSKVFVETYSIQASAFRRWYGRYAAENRIRRAKAGGQARRAKWRNRGKAKKTQTAI